MVSCEGVGGRRVGALEGGLSFKLTMGNIITLCPPLTATRADMDAAFAILDECIGLAAEERA